MSIKVIDMVADRVLGKPAFTPQTDKNVLKTLASFASDCGKGVWASNSTVGDRAGVTRETASRAIGRLKIYGLIVNTGRRVEGKTFTQVYAIDLVRLSELPLTKTAQAHIDRLSSGRYLDVTDGHNPPVIGSDGASQRKANDVTLEGVRCDADDVNDVTERHTNRPINPNEPPLGQRIEFFEFWRAYPLTDGQVRGPSKTNWEKLSPAEQSAAMDYLPAYKKILKGREAAYPFVFIRDRMWDDGSDHSAKAATPTVNPYEAGSALHDVFERISQRAGPAKANAWFSAEKTFVNPEHPNIIHADTNFTVGRWRQDFGYAFKAAGVKIAGPYLKVLETEGAA